MLSYLFVCRFAYLLSILQKNCWMNFNEDFRDMHEIEREPVSNIFDRLVCICPDCFTFHNFCVAEACALGVLLVYPFFVFLPDGYVVKSITRKTLKRWIMINNVFHDMFYWHLTQILMNTYPTTWIQHDTEIEQLYKLINFNNAF